MLKKVISPFLRKGLALVLAIPLTGHSATYYVSSSGGNDANDGLSEATPWQTLTNINANPTSLETNSIILFKRGDIFRGSLQNPQFPEGLTFGAYGAGTSNPVIAGSVEITGWTLTSHPELGPNVYEANVSGLPLTDKGIEHLFVNGQLMTIARYPNVNSPADKNWLQVAGVPGSQGTFKNEQDQFKIDENQFKDPGTGELYPRFKTNDYWKGATLRIRNYSWTFRVIEVTGYNASEGKIIVAGKGGQLPEWGYFLDNKLTELDHPGEWYYDAGAQKVYLYPLQGTDPNTLLVEGSTYDTGIKIGKNATIENLTFRHFTSTGAQINNQVIIRNCHFEHNSVGVGTWNAGESLITNNTFHNQIKRSIALGGGIDGVNNTVIEKNQIINTAMYPAYGVSDGIYYGIAINASGKGYTIRQNTIENTSWNGIYLKGEGHHIIKNNVIHNSLMLLNDGGNISIGSDGNIIEGNFLFDSVGNVDESNGCMNDKNPCNHHPSYGMGIGADSNFKNHVIENNTIANNPDRGIRLNAFVNTIVRNNIVYNNDTQQIIVQDGKGPSHDNVVEGNIIYPLNPDQIGIEMSGTTNHGTFNKNYYCNPYSEVVMNRNGQNYSLAHWQNQFPPNDNQSTWCGISFKEYSFSSTGPNMITNFDNIQRNLLTWVENQYYRLKFGVTGKGFGTFRISINDTQQGTDILKRRHFAYDQSRKEYEIFFLSPVNTTAGKLVFQTTTDGSAAYELDNVVFEPVAVAPIDARQLSNLLTNPTETPTSIPLQAGETYRLVHIKNGEVIEETVTGSVTLEPLSSAILISSSGAIINPPSPTPPPSSSNYLLTVQSTGKGSGTITLSPMERSCRVSCEQTYTSGTLVTLSAEPSSGSIFTGWSDACTGTKSSTTITMDEPKNCVAHFDLDLPPSSPTPNHTLTLNQSGTGSGTISSNPSGIVCGTDCTEKYAQGTTVELTATPTDDKSVFASWSGDCSGNKSSLTVMMDTSKNCTARFELKSSLPPSPTFYTLTVTKMGNGTVTSNPEGIACGTTCVAQYPSDITEVFLKATPALGSQFLGFNSDENCTKDGKVILNKSVVSCVANFGTFEISSPSPSGSALTINKAGSGSGKVTSQPAGADCGESGEKCTQNYTDDTVVILTATPAGNSLFAGWTDACSHGGTSLSVAVTMEQAKNCTANFELSSSPSPTTTFTTLLVTKQGSGFVTSDPPGMTCGQTTTCSANYSANTVVTLLPIAAPDSQFIGFSGDPDCIDGEVTLNKAIECKAIFESFELVEVVPDQTPICTKISNTFRGTCNGQGETMKDFTMHKNSSLSNVVLEGTIINDGGWLANATIDSQATVIGGIATGYIINEGIMANIEFRGKTLIGGELSGIITNTKEGIIQNVQLAADTKITGGRAGGKIEGEPEAPAVLENLTVEAGSELSNIIIGENVQLPNYEVLKEGVKFASSEAIPFEVELISLLPTLPEPSCRTQPPLYDLSKDILPGGAGVLSSINELSELTTNDWQLIQDNSYGYLRMITDQGQFAVYPRSIKRALDESQMQLSELQETRFITHTGLEILDQPAVQAPCELQAALEKLNLPNLTVQDDGNLKVVAEKEGLWYSARPDLYSIEVADDTTLGLSFPDSPVISGIQRASMVFVDSDGKTREQLFYPALAGPEALLASAQEVVMEYSGEVSFKLDGQSYHGVVDYLITQSEHSSSNKVQVISLPDVNGDQIEDFTLVYSTGDQQIIFAFPADN